ncbi:MAG: hypothetical protein JEZ08_21945 [Clostridiales bacterium]|nr:hypothetical protein [Clostridiales bacterium]
MSKKLLTSITVLALLLSTMSFAAFAETEVATDVTEEPTEAVEATDELSAEEVEEVVEPVLSYLKFDLEEEVTFVIEDGIVVDVITNTTEEITEEPADETTEEPADETTEEPADETTEEPADETTEEPADETTEEPADETTEEPADETTEEPADETPVVDEEVAEEILNAPYASYIGLPVVEAVGTFIEENEITEAVEVQILGNKLMIEELEDALNESFEELLDVDTIALDSENPNAERFVNAAKLQITNGKMNLLEKLKASTDAEEFDYSEWSDLSVKEIMASIKANKKDAKFNVESDDLDEIDEASDEAKEEEVKVQKTSPSKAKSNNGKAKGKK